MEPWAQQPTVGRSHVGFGVFGVYPSALLSSGHSCRAELTRAARNFWGTWGSITPTRFGLLRGCHII